MPYNVPQTNSSNDANQAAAMQFLLKYLGSNLGSGQTNATSPPPEGTTYNQFTNQSVAPGAFSGFANYFNRPGDTELLKGAGYQQYQVPANSQSY